ncbi:Fanconi anemia group M protein isoform X2 [Cephus cinctus]|uniref:Fanconi anemia group M protein isoform X2 n=1 Tax=Cephus cinctus TaxID=211228 RepID=A0AAJ7RJ58_CEPCN|nr:Fanconi anemia group M protein isoform X2 [Cephus cinctus]
MENISSTPRVSSDPSTKGLGKTFIAAVVMFNFWRWFPQGKVVFMAPTKPLVAQQIHACHDIMGIPSEETVEVTGATMNAKQRRDIWRKKRVIFATPQIFHNDLKNNIIDVHSIKCVVIDEAHRASKKHSYCEGIHLLSEQNTNFRILALSATPGGRVDDVLKVIKNLHISSLEMRDDFSPDITPYINNRKIDIIPIQLSKELKAFEDRYVFIMDRHVKILIQRGVIRGNTGDISKGMIYKISQEFKTRTNKSGDHDFLAKTLTILMTMYHAYHLLKNHGLRAFKNFYQNHSDKYWMKKEMELQSLLEDVDKYLGPFPDIDSILSDDGVPQIPDNLVYGHSKFHKLKEILEEHFRSFESNNKETRAIVFVEYRDIVNEVYVMLLQSHPLLRPQKFMGQASQRQKEQLRALNDFRNNKVNVLVSTCVGEEGLDVGEVDLIVCFDIMQNNPTRLVQRMGRTGRRRDGHIIILVTEGKEYLTLQQAMKKKDSLNKQILESSNITSWFYEDNPRMIPPECNPECYKMHIAVLPKTSGGKKGRKKKFNEKEEVKGKKKMPNNEDTITAIDDEIPCKSSTSKQGSQSTIMTYFKNAKLPQTKPTDKNENNILAMFKNSSRAESTTGIKPENVKLLTSDAKIIDFLTMCAMRESEIENSVCTRKVIDSRYIPSYPVEDAKRFLNGPALDSNILNCLTELNEQSSCVSPEREEVFENDFEDDADQNFNPLEFLPEDNEVNVKDYIPETSKYDDGYISEVVMDNDGYIEEVSKFEAVMDDSSSSSINSNNENKHKSNILLEKSHFEALLSESSSASSIITDNEYEKTMKMNADSIQDRLNVDCNNHDTTINMKFGDVSKSPKINSDEFEMARDVESDHSQGFGLFERVLDDSSEESENQPLPVTENSTFKKSQECIHNINENSIFKGSIIGDSISNHDENSNDMFESMDEDFDIDEIPDENAWISKETSKAIGIKDSKNLNSFSSFDGFKNDIKLENDTIGGREEGIDSFRFENSTLSITKSLNQTIKTQSENDGKYSNLSTHNNEKLAIPNNSASSENLQENKMIKDFKQVSNTTVDDDINRIEILDSDEDIFNDLTIIEDNINNCNIISPIGTNQRTNENDVFPPISSLKNSLNETKKNSEATIGIVQLDSSQENSKSSPEIANKIEVSSTIKTRAEMFDLTLEGKEELNVSNFNWDDDFVIPQNPITDVKQFQKTTSTPQPPKISSFKMRLDKLKRHTEPNKSNIDKTSSSKINDPKMCTKVSLDRYFITPRKKLSNIFKHKSAQPSCSWQKPSEESSHKYDFNISNEDLEKVEELESSYFGNDNNSRSPISKSVLNNKLNLTKPQQESPLRQTQRKEFRLKQHEVNKFFLSTKVESDDNEDITPWKVSNIKQVKTINDQTARKHKSHKKKNMAGRVKNEFLDNEVEVSSEGECTSEGTSGEDGDLSGFVSYTQDVKNPHDMQAHYLESIRSPVKLPGGFCFRKPKTPVADMNIYSQTVEDDSYLYDSFCVRENDLTDNGSTEYSILEDVEKKLSSRKRKRKGSSDSRGNTKRIINRKMEDGTSSEDETELLRKETLDQSFMIRTKNR